MGNEGISTVLDTMPATLAQTATKTTNSSVSLSPASCQGPAWEQVGRPDWAQMISVPGVVSALTTLSRGFQGEVLTIHPPLQVWKVSFGGQQALLGHRDLIAEPGYLHHVAPSR